MQKTQSKKLHNAYKKMHNIYKRSWTKKKRMHNITCIQNLPRMHTKEDMDAAENNMQNIHCVRCTMRREDVQYTQKIYNLLNNSATDSWRGHTIHKKKIESISCTINTKEKTHIHTNMLYEIYIHYEDCRKFIFFKPVFNIWLNYVRVLAKRINYAQQQGLCLAGFENRGTSV